MRIAFVPTDIVSAPGLYQGSRRRNEPLDLMYAIAHARARGHVASLIGIQADTPPAGPLTESDVVIMSTTNGYLQWNNHPLGLGLVESTICSLRQLAPSVPIVAFGPHVSNSRAEILDLGVAGVVAGEAELDVVLLAEQVAARRPSGPADPGLAVVTDLNTLPRPAWECTIGECYSAHNRIPGRRQAGHLYEASRGCPFQCSYCNTITHRRTYRVKSPAKVRDDLEWLAGKTSSDYVYFIDESFGANSTWFEMLAPHLKGLPFSYGCQSNLKFLSEKKLLQMRDAGFESLEFGFETADEEVLMQAGKRNHATNAKLINLAASMGLNPLLFILLGLPGSTRVSNTRTMEFLSTLDDRVRISVGLPTPYPGTRLHHMGKAEGKLSGKRGLQLYEAAGTIGNALHLNNSVRDQLLEKFGPNTFLNRQNLNLLEKYTQELFLDDPSHSTAQVPNASFN